MSESGKCEFSFIWQIENYSHCIQELGNGYLSPTFCANTLENTIWQLQIEPISSETEYAIPGVYHACNKDDDYIALFLQRLDGDDGPEGLEVNFEFSLLDKDGYPLKVTEVDYLFRRYTSAGVIYFVKRREVFVERKAEYLPNDTLTVCCRIWTIHEGVSRTARSCSRTRFGIETVVLSTEAAFLKRLEHFESVYYDIQSSSIEKPIAKLHLYGTDGLCCEGKIIAEIIPSVIKLEKFVSCALFLIDTNGKRTKCGQAEFGDDFRKQSSCKFPLFFAKDKIMEDLSPDALNRITTIECELKFSNRLETHKIVRTDHGFPLPSVLPNKADGKLCPSVLEDLKALYDDQCLCDIKLKTKTEIFPAHKMVLCARSPVFRAMLTHDMKEKMTDCINVHDLEDETVKQFLSFLYTETLEYLQWETAAKLYYAADK